MDARAGRSFYVMVDANNFYVSCERVFDGTLDGRPVVILSNNGYDEVEDYVVGSTTERVIRRSTVPVLVV